MPTHAPDDASHTDALVCPVRKPVALPEDAVAAADADAAADAVAAADADAAAAVWGLAPAARADAAAVAAALQIFDHGDDTQMTFIPDSSGTHWCGRAVLSGPQTRPLLPPATSPAG